MTATIDLDGSRIIVTGASKGLGRALAQDLFSRGARLVLNGRDGDALEELAAGLGDPARVAVAVGSISDEATARGVVEAAVAAYGGLDGLVNNAGILRDRTLLKMTVEEFDDVIATNLRGTWLCTRYGAEAMRDHGGVILNVVSNVAFHGSVGQSNYAASKAGVAGLTRALSVELARYGIRVNALWPVAMTDMTAGVAAAAAERARGQGGEAPPADELGFGDPAAVAPVASLLLSDRTAHLNGQVVSFNGRRMAVWTHPAEVHLERRPAWSDEDILAYLAPEAGVGQPLNPPEFP